jgi:hypothetical protein
VAQTGGLLYRRLATGWGFATTGADFVYGADRHSRKNFSGPSISARVPAKVLILSALRFNLESGQVQ